ncbi:hypothetical protein [Trujillonella humicola]|uniref:hypothetical protein n=1 Tax=Trujillonella humicola TaxID=3383699 RepID=UPI003905CC65
MGKLSLALGIGVGYVLGTRAGRERYQQIQQATARLTGRPEVQQAVGKVRETLPPPLQGAVDKLVESSPSGGPATTSSAGGGFPLEDGEPVSQTFSAFGERSAAAPSTGAGSTGGQAPVVPAPDDEEPVAQTFSAFTERSADEPRTDPSR